MTISNKLLVAWLAQLEVEFADGQIAAALRSGKAVQVVLYADANGKPGKIKVTGS